MVQKVTRLKAIEVEDAELFNPDLDWYYGCFDSECGLRSAEGGIADALADGAARARRGASAPACDKCRQPTTRASVGLACRSCGHTQAAQIVPVKHSSGGGVISDPYGDAQVRWSGEGSFSRGRRIRNRLTSLPWSIQEDLRLCYEPRRDRPAMTEDRVRKAHRTYTGAANGS